MNLRNAVDLHRLKRDLPDWPDDVLEQWILIYANQAGWPPPEPLAVASRWYALLSKRPLSWWRDVKWEMREVEFEFNSLSDIDKEMSLDMLGAYFKGAQNGYSFITDGRARVISSYNFVREHGRFPRPIIAVQIASGLRVVDGSHRVVGFLAYLAASKNNSRLKPPDRKQQVWVGEHISGEQLK